MYIFPLLATRYTILYLEPSLLQLHAVRSALLVFPVADTSCPVYRTICYSTVSKCITHNHLLSWSHHDSQLIITETKIFRFELQYLATLSACRQCDVGDSFVGR